MDANYTDKTGEVKSLDNTSTLIASMLSTT